MMAEEQRKAGMERELALEFVRITEVGAMAAARLMGRGNRVAAEKAAADAMRAMFSTVQVQARLVVGGGESDEVVVLEPGEEFGTGDPPEVDVAIDPVEGTNLVAKGLPNAICVLAAAPRGCLLQTPDIYMEKIAVGPRAAGAIDLDAPVAVNLREVARALGCSVEDLTVVVLDRPRHENLIREVREAGARIKLISDGDVAPAVAAAIEEGGVDLLLGIGGAPEGLLTAAALKCLGGDMQARMLPRSEQEAALIRRMGLADIRRILRLDDMVRGDDVIFAATGITDGDLLRGVRFSGRGVLTHSVVMRSRTGTVRFIEARHHPAKKPAYGRSPSTSG